MGTLRFFFCKAHQEVKGPVTGFFLADHLYQPVDVGGKEIVQTGRPRWIGDRCHQPFDEKSGGVADQYGIRSAHRVQVLKNLDLEVHLFHRRLDDQITRCQIPITGGTRYHPGNLIHLRLGHFALGHPFFECPLHPSIILGTNQFVVQFLVNDTVPGRCRIEPNGRAHHAEPYDSYGFNVCHLSSFSLLRQNGGDRLN
jgi:hypothetical protein